MATKTQTKCKVTLSLTPEIVQALDAKAQVQGGSRSAALVHVLNEWQSRESRQQRETEELEAATTAYYATQSDAERSEEDDWAAFAGHAAARMQEITLAVLRALGRVSS